MKGKYVMRFKIICSVLSCLLFFVIHSIAGENNAKKAPIAFLPEQTFEFEPVIEGTEVSHDFILKNKGNAPLIIEETKPDKKNSSRLENILRKLNEYAFIVK